jgi:hypothetical protein
LDCIEYERSFSACLTKVVKGDAKMALITNDISIDDVKTVCKSGCTLNQKSTHFLIEKETLKKRITNHEYRTPKEGIFSIISFKRAKQSDIHNSSIDNRHSSFQGSTNLRNFAVR